MRGYKSILLEEKSREIHHKIISISIPLIISNVTTPLLGLINIGLLGHNGSFNSIAALGAGSMIFNLLYSILHFLKMTTTGFAARAYGRNDSNELKMTLARSVIISLSLGLFLIIASPLLMWLTEHTMHTDQILHNEISDYTYIRIIAAPAALTNIVLIGFYIGVQRADFALLLSLTISSTAIAGGYLLIHIAHLSITGIALADVIAQYTGTLLGIKLCLSHFKKHRPINFNWKEIFITDKMRRYFIINSNISIRSICLIGSLTIFTTISARKGVIVLATNTLILSIQSFTSNFIDGIANATETMVGEKKQSLIDIIQLTLAWTLFIGMILCLTYNFFSDDIVVLLTSNKTLQTNAANYWPALIVLTTIAPVSYWLDGIFSGLLKSIDMRNSMIISMLGFLVILCVLSKYGNTGLLTSLCFFYLLRLLTLGRKLMIHFK